MTTTSGVSSPVVSGTTPLPASSSPTSAAAATSALASSQIAGNFQSFLTLLTTQLQNQNPLDPLDTNQFTQQLVEFAGVQQQLNTNDSLATLVSLQQTAQSTQALGFVGKTAVVNGSTAALTTAPRPGSSAFPPIRPSASASPAAPGKPSSPAATPSAPATTSPSSGTDRVADGTQLPDGNYTMTATAKDASNNTVAVSTQIQGVVSSVDLTQSPPLLTIGGQTYTVNQIQSIVD